MFSTKLDRVANRYCHLILSKSLENGKSLENDTGSDGKARYALVFEYWEWFV